jgi:hypothetical protein
MFDDQQLQSNQQLATKPTEEPMPAGPAPEMPAPAKKKKGLMIILIIVLVLLVIGAAAYTWYKFFYQPESGPEAEIPAMEQPETTEPPIVEEPADLDTDNDGLLDSEEQNLGTAITSVDTDNDGLNDFDEVKIYNTNPLNKDTDVDGYLDGEEVKNGYNPNGPGKLLNFEMEKNNAEQTAGKI